MFEFTIVMDFLLMVSDVSFGISTKITEVTLEILLRFVNMSCPFVMCQIFVKFESFATLITAICCFILTEREGKGSVLA